MTADDLRELAATALAYIAARDAEPEPLRVIQGGIS
jgi:hypothetical protein